MNQRKVGVGCIYSSTLTMNPVSQQLVLALAGNENDSTHLFDVTKYADESTLKLSPKQISKKSVLFYISKLFWYILECIMDLWEDIKKVAR